MKPRNSSSTKMRRTTSNADLMRSSDKKPRNLSQTYIMTSTNFNKTVERSNKFGKVEKSRKTVKQFDEINEREFSLSRFDIEKEIAL